MSSTSANISESEHSFHSNGVNNAAANTSSSSGNVPIYAITGLSHILSVSNACQILGEPVVRHLVKAFLRSTASHNPSHNNGNGNSANRNNKSQQSSNKPTATSSRDKYNDIPFHNLPHAVDPTEADDEVHWVDLLTKALMYDFDNTHTQNGHGKDERSKTGGNNDAKTKPQAVPVRPWVLSAWHRMMNFPPQSEYTNLTLQQQQHLSSLNSKIPFPLLGLDKSTFLRSGIIFPSCIAPHAGTNGHLALLECLFYALATPPTTALVTRLAKVANAIPKSGVGFREWRNYCRREYSKAMVDGPTGGGAESGPGSSHNMRNPSAQRTLLLLPDLIIFFGVTKRYNDLFVDNMRINDRCRGIEKTTNATGNDLVADANCELKITKEGENYIISMARLTYRMYDAFQKKGAISRDSIHKFLSDIYGEDSYAKASVKGVLDQMFGENNKEGNGVDKAPPKQFTSLNEAQYIQSSRDTVSIIPGNFEYPNRLEHILFDWFVRLGNAILPNFMAQLDAFYSTTTPVVGIGTSLQAKYDMIQTQNTGDADIQKLYRIFAISEVISGSKLASPSKNSRMGIVPSAAHMSLFQVKRRFRSIIEKGLGNRCDSENDGEESDTNGSNSSSSFSSIEEEGHHLPIEEDAGETLPSKSSLSRLGDLPKNVIDDDVLIQAVSSPDEDMGHGGFITPKLAKLLFRSVCIRFKKDRNGQSSDSRLDALIRTGTDVNDEQDHDADKGDSQEMTYWDMFDFLSFGCNAVRGELISEDSDLPILELLFLMFSLLPSSGNFGIPETIDTEYEMKKGNEETEAGEKPASLNKVQIAHMVLLLIEHYSFRLKADSSQTEDNSLIAFDASGDLIDAEVDVSVASLLGLLPKSIHDEDVSRKTVKGTKISLQALVDYVFEEIHTTSPNSSRKDDMNCTDFIAWHKKSCNTSSLHKVGSLIIDMRLIGACVFGIKPYSPSMERNLVKEIQNRFKYKYPSSESAKRGPLGTTWYIINTLWWKEWERYSKEGRHFSLPSINNDQLLASNRSLALRAGLRFRYDYELLPPLAWSALQGWHDGGPPISRTVAPFHEKGPLSSERKGRSHEIELHPMFITILLSDSSSGGEPRPFQQCFPVSRYLPLRSLLENLCQSLDVDSNDARLWVNHSRAILKLDNNIIQQLKTKKIINGEEDIMNKNVEIVVELKDEEGGWPSSQKEVKYDEKNRHEEQTSPLGVGIVGLHNMGNTCYMNSSIQCLSHTPILRDYFTTKSYLNDINRTNPLGYEGHLAQVSAVLFNTLWRRPNPTRSLSRKKLVSRQHVPLNVPCLTPKTFKDTLGRLNSDFSGNEQHDAQELLNFLLSGLSEDLNRIMEKPYTEAPDSDGRPDKELADIWWSNHLKREMSIIVALFTGQYKSLLTCQTCQYESARFEPFCSIEVPLPEDDQVSVQLVYFSLKENSVATKYSVRARHDGKLFDVLVTLAKVLHGDNDITIPERNDKTSSTQLHNNEHNVDNAELYDTMAKNMTVVRMESGYIANIQPESWSIDKIYNRDTGEIPMLFVYELDPKLPKSKIESNVYKEIDDKNPTSKEENKGDGGNNTSTPTTSAVKYSFLAMCQRRVELSHAPFLHYWYHRVFGTPFILRIADLEGYTGRDLYDLVAKRLIPYVSEKVIKIISKRLFESNSMDEVDNAGAPGKLRKGRRQRFNHTCAGSESSAFGNMPRYGFRLRVTSREGKRCEVCPWYDCCAGCLITDDDYPTIAMCGDTIAIDWHIGVDLATDCFDSLSNGAEPRGNMLTNTKKHKTCHGGKNKFGKECITLEDCLDAFTKEEKMPDTYCSKCKDLRMQKKAMSLWRLPPVMIITLKRFQFTEKIKRKLRDYVHFPVEGLDISRVVAADDEITSPKSNGNGEASKSEDNALRPDIHCGRNESLYDLYAVIHHQGALTGGHYVASMKSEVDGKWRLFNDAAVYDVSSKDVVDASAYILFYVRRDVKDASLENFWDTQPREGEGMTEEEVEKMMKQKDRCVIS
uniref:ubiquitinyl hydrolase 1 n=1 Tax=Chaetoceros debilis TaxID=122233 RepID=A0A7S3V7L3_9STRA